MPQRADSLLCKGWGEVGACAPCRGYGRNVLAQGASGDRRVAEGARRHVPGGRRDPAGTQEPDASAIQRQLDMLAELNWHKSFHTH